jgi:glycosyltransferase involved in cell wall biosynthesis
MGKNKNKLPKLPFVTLCTPTFNRRPFIPIMIKCFEIQTYPKDRIEWIIVDDGTDKIEDLIKDIPQIKYLKFDEKMTLGKKRNFMHSKCTGDIIVYMDDDDYYPPERISHAVDTLIKNPNYMIVGSSLLAIYYKSIGKMYEFGPYVENHSTAASFAFRKELLKKTKYNDDNCFGEEKFFLKDYTIPLKQLDIKKTILVISHKHNTYNKENLLDRLDETLGKESRLLIDEFIKEPKMKQFYLNDVDELLDAYDPGKPENKPETMKQIKEKEEIIKKQKEEQEKFRLVQSQIANANVNNMQFQEVIKKYEKQIEDKTILINELLKKVKELTNELNTYKNK